MKLNARQVNSFLNAPDEKIVLVLIYGPDSGLVRERAELLAAKAGADPDDPFQTITLSDQDLKSDPARISDEAAAIPMFGGRRVVRLENISESAAAPVTAFIKDIDAGSAQCPGYIIVEGGDLTPRSSLRKTAESSKFAAAIPCYSDTPEAVSALVQNQLSAAGLSISPDALDFVVARLGDDRRATRMEIEKLVSYAGGSRSFAPVTEISLQDAEASMGDLNSYALDQVADAVSEGNLQNVDRELTRCFDSGVNPVAVLRTISGHFQKLLAVRAELDQGADFSRAVGKLRPPLHFKRKDAFQRQTRIWSAPTISRALGMIMETEALCKTTGMPDQSACWRLCLQLSGAARSRSRAS